MRLPRDIAPELKHSPTAFDISVLLLLLGMGQEGDTRTLKIALSAELLRALRMRVGVRARQRLRAALHYWSQLTIIYHECWHRVGTKQPMSNTMPPPIAALSPQGQGWMIELHRQWTALGKQYFSHVTLPLPRRWAEAPDRSP